MKDNLVSDEDISNTHDGLSNAFDEMFPTITGTVDDNIFEQKPEMTFHEACDKLREMRKLFRGEPGSFNIREAIEDGRR
jgi:hypothetical protein